MYSIPSTCSWPRLVALENPATTGGAKESEAAAAGFAPASSAADRATTQSGALSTVGRRFLRGDAAPGYLLRLAREEAGLSQAELAQRLECTQQAVAQAERWKSNPTVGILRRWAAATSNELHLALRPASDP